MAVRAFPGVAGAEGGRLGGRGVDVVGGVIAKSQTTLLLIKHGLIL